MSLPPLPPVPGVDDELWRPGGSSVLDVLAAEHRLIVGLAARLRDTGDPVTREVLVATVSRHLSAEEQYLYPMIRKVLPDGAPVAGGELAADQALRQLLGADDPAALHAALHSHAARLDGPLAARLADACGENDLIRLGNRVLIAAEAAPTRPHPSLPLTPPANKLVAPVVGLVDKVRDLVSGRPTYA